MAPGPDDAPMKTKVVNLKHAPFDVYIGRAGHGEAGLFGNPIKKGGRCQECGDVHETGGATLPCFEKYFLRRVETDADFRQEVLALRGKTLGCFCAPRPCHGMLISTWIDKQFGGSTHFDLDALKNSKNVFEQNLHAQVQALSPSQRDLLDTWLGTGAKR
jgi:hypothetical protein